MKHSIVNTKNIVSSRYVGSTSKNCNKGVTTSNDNIMASDKVSEQMLTIEVRQTKLQES